MCFCLRIVHVVSSLCRRCRQMNQRRYRCYIDQTNVPLMSRNHIPIHSNCHRHWYLTLANLQVHVEDYVMVRHLGFQWSLCHYKNKTVFKTKIMSRPKKQDSAIMCDRHSWEPKRSTFGFSDVIIGSTCACVVRSTRVKVKKKTGKITQWLIITVFNGICVIKDVCVQN